MLYLLALGVALVGPVPEAIERSIHERMGDVRVAVVEIVGSRVSNLDPEGENREPRARSRKPILIAAPEPGSRLGRPVRFILFADGQRVGSVVARLDVAGDAVRARKAIARDERIGRDDIEVADVELKDVLLRRLPTVAEIDGAEARRDIRAGEMLIDAVLRVPPVVRSGDEVSVTIAAEAVTVTGRGRASGSGRTGDFIRVLLPSSRKGLKARITGPGSVELTPGLACAGAAGNVVNDSNQLDSRSGSRSKASTQASCGVIR